MKFFAITPDDCAAEGLISSLSLLKEKGVWGLYLRSPALGADLEQVSARAAKAGMVPIVHYRGYEANRFCLEKFKAGVHFKSNEFSRGLRETFSAGICTVSAHSTEEADRLLTRGADYVFLSPVFRPFSKKQTNLNLLLLEDIRQLVSVYVERVVLLGGMTPERIEMLARKLRHDFSVAGITLFF